MAIKTYGKVGVSPKGEWNSDAEYKLLNLVSYNGSSYVVKAVNADGIVPVGTLPTNTDYYQLSAQGGGVATEDAPGVVKPDGDTIDVDEGGTISVKTATQTTLGAVTGSDDIVVGSDGELKVNTNFEQAVELGNIIAGEAIKEVFGKVAKSIATLMNLNKNAILKGMLANQYENNSNTIPTSALLYSLSQDVINVNSNLTLVSNDLPVIEYGDTEVVQIPANGYIDITITHSKTHTKIPMCIANISALSTSAGLSAGITVIVINRTLTASTIRMLNSGATALSSRCGYMIVSQK